MDDAAPITWLINQINALVTAGSATVADAISGAVAPIASACFGIYVILITINYMRGAETEPVVDFIVRMASWALIIGLGLNTSNYDSIVAPIVTGLGTDFANAASGGTVTAGTLDTLALTYLNIYNAGMTAAAAVGGLSGIGMEIVVGIKGLIMMFCLVPFLVAATLCIIVANVGSQIIAMVGPLFFAFLLFPATRQYFSSWVNTALSYALIPLIIAVVASLSVSLSTQMLPTGTLVTATFTQVFLASIGNLILLFFLKTVATLASSLSAGGINAAMPGGVGAAAKSLSNSAKGIAKELKAMRREKDDSKDTGGSMRKAG